MCDSWVQLKWIKILSQKEQTVVSNELLCLLDVNIDLFLWVLVREKKVLRAFQEFLCLADGGVLVKMKSNFSVSSTASLPEFCRRIIGVVLPPAVAKISP